MFEQSPKPAPQGARVLAPEGEPIEFVYNGRHFHIHTVTTRWRESGGWWNRIDDGDAPRHRGRAGNSADALAQTIFNDGARAIWRVEAAPVGALATFEIELDEITGTWQIRPTSRPR